MDQADAEVHDYVYRCMDAFRAHADAVYLGELERIVFGWVEADDDHATLLGP